MLLQILSLIAASLIVVTASMGLYKQWLENHLLRIKLRRALQDVRAFYEIEDRLCSALALSLDSRESALTIKRGVREAVRRDGMLSPSGYSTPHYISQMLAEL
jgi:hypothetical protein